jgi:hypothetical protein
MYWKVGIKMSIKLLLLKSGENVISDVKELVSEEKVCGYLLINPQKLRIEQPFLVQDTIEEETTNEIKISMSPWIVLTNETDIAISPDWVVTLTEPIESVKSMYEEKMRSNYDSQNSSLS